MAGRIRALRSGVLSWSVLALLFGGGARAEREPFLLEDVNADPAPVSSTPASFVDVGGTLFFRATDVLHGKELWRSDGTVAGTFMVTTFPRTSSVGRPSSGRRAYSSIVSSVAALVMAGTCCLQQHASDGDSFQPLHTAISPVDRTL